MRTNTFLCLGLLFCAASATATDAVVRARMATEIAALTAPELAGRGAGTPEEHAAAAMIAGWFADAGLEPLLETGWLQDVPIPAHLGGGRSVNAMGVLPGAGDLAGRWLVLGAHLDHLGRVDPSLTGIPAAGAYYPGAGDNAAGVAAALAVVRMLRDRDAADPQAPRRSLLVCAFGAEEIGLVGSAHLAANLPITVASVDAMVNLDAVGRLGDGPLHVAGLESSAVLPDLVTACAGPLPINAHRGGPLGSDHASFLAHRIPALLLFTGGYPQMNSPADSLAAVDLDGLVTVARFTTRLLTTLRAQRDPLPFDHAPAAPTVVAGDRRTWFGSVPDFAGDDGDGYRIGGVSEGGPAASAGLVVGDRVVSLAGQPVSDLATFTAALRRYGPGDVVEVVAERDGRRLGFLVTLADRAERVH